MLADLLDDFVVANGLPDHTTPSLCAMQLGSMLRVQGVKGNTSDQDLLTPSHLYAFANSIVLTRADLW